MSVCWRSCLGLVVMVKVGLRDGRYFQRSRRWYRWKGSAKTSFIIVRARVLHMKMFL